MEADGGDNNDWIKLNVGGFRFETTVKTLLMEDSMLSRMVASEIPTSKDEDGCIKIDRPGKHFNQILDYLRSGMFPTFGSIKDAEELKIEADYYLIGELKRKCESFIEEFRKHDTILVRELVLLYEYDYGNYIPQRKGSGVFGIGIPRKMDGSISLSYLRMAFPKATGLCRHNSSAEIEFEMLQIVGDSIQLPKDYQNGVGDYYVLPIKAWKKA